ncbi:NACHT domain-containing protein [Actinoplanes sp. HUAS TT8]|uniref:NACHT domain-containing protein n=1 Tax=Actinoplanes sp. HUAS TT8 TaxID=3447453 RepID=UPI003F52804D
MPGGRPPRAVSQPHPELAEIASWFRDALAEAGYPSVHAFVQRHSFDKNKVYGFLGGTRFLTLESCRALAVALRRDPAEADRLWWRAKQASDRQAAAERDRVGNGTPAWETVPWPSAALQDILEAQAQAVETLPYRLLGVEPPPLSAVYVRQQVRTRTAEHGTDTRPENPDRERVESAGAEKPIPVVDALDRHEHLVITGEPGAGKSTFGQYLVLQLSRLWLREWNGDRPPVEEPVVPLRIPARALLGARSWASGLAAATRTALGLRLVSEPAASLFEHRIAGVRWLVVVDGLDEIVDRAARTEVIQALAARCRPGGDYRIVVTTRELPEVEFAPLRTQHVGAYSMEPFGREELGTFATQWFTAQGKPDPSRDAARFLHQSADGRLRELVRNPLLATIAAITGTLGPDRPLPASRLDLYERFLEHLLDGRDTVAELRRAHAGRPERLRFAAWLVAERRPLLRELGVVRLAGEQPLLDAAQAWVVANLPPSTSCPGGWEADLREVLSGTGLLSYEGDRLRFLHHSFAEYLAAEEHAERVGPEFTDLEDWIARGLKPAEREFVLFVFARWARRPGHDLSRIVEPLLLGNPQRALLAGRLLADLPIAPPRLKRRVIDRLRALAVYHSIRSDLTLTVDQLAADDLVETEPDLVMEVLGGFTDDPEVAERLTALAEDPRTYPSLRVSSARVLGRVSGPEAALARLESLAAELRGYWLLLAARAAHEVAPAAPLARRLFEQICRGKDGFFQAVRADAAAELALLGETTLAGATAREVVLGGRLADEGLRTAVQTWFESLPEEAARGSALMELRDIALTPGQRAGVAEGLVNVGLREEATPFVMAALSRLSDVGLPAHSMVAAWARPGDERLPEAMELIRRCPRSRARSFAALGMADAGCRDGAVELATAILADARSDGYTLGSAVVAWLTAAPEHLPQVLDAVRRWDPRRAVWFWAVVSALAETGFADEAADVARTSFEAAVPDVWPHAAGQMVSAWLNAGGRRAAPAIMAQIDEIGGFAVQSRAKMAAAFAENGCLSEAASLLGDVVGWPGLSVWELIPAVKVVVLTRGESGADEVVRTVTEGERDTIVRLVAAEHLAAAGYLDRAHRVWLFALTWQPAPYSCQVTAAERLVSTGGAETAIEVLAGHPDPVVAGRRRLLS